MKGFLIIILLFDRIKITFIIRYNLIFLKHFFMLNPNWLEEDNNNVWVDGVDELSLSQVETDILTLSAQWKSPEEIIEFLWDDLPEWEILSKEDIVMAVLEWLKTPQSPEFKDALEQTQECVSSVLEWPHDLTSNEINFLNSQREDWILDEETVAYLEEIAKNITPDDRSDHEQTLTRT